MCKQHLDDGTTPFGHYVQRCFSIGGGYGHTGTMLQKQRGTSFTFRHACNMERRLTNYSDRTDIGAMLQKKPGARFMVVQACKVECCSTILLDRAYVGTMLQK